MKAAGLKLGPVLSLTHETLFKSEFFYDREGPFREEWRNGDRYGWLIGLNCRNSRVSFFKNLASGKGKRTVECNSVTSRKSGSMSHRKLGLLDFVAI